MKILLRWVLGLAAVALLLSVALSLAVMLLIDPDDYKDDIAALVSEQTGRAFTIDGNLDLQAFPCCGIALGPLTLGNPPGFPDEPFARIGRAVVDVQLWPLLTRRELRFGKIELQELDARLLSRADGTVNWDFGTAETAEPSTATNEKVAADINLAIAGIEVTDGKLGYVDEATGEAITVNDIDLSTSTIRPGEPFDLKASLVAEGLMDNRLVDLKAQAQVTPNADSTQFDVAQLDSNVQLTGKDLPGGAVALDIGLAAARGIGTERVELQDLRTQIDVAGVKLEIRGGGALVNNVPELQGQISTGTFSPQNLLQAIGEDPVVTRDKDVLQSAQLQADWQYAGDTAALENIVSTLDDSKINGWLRIASIEKEQLAFDIQIDVVDLDRYAGPEEAPSANEAGTKAASKKDAFGLPVEQLRALNADGRLAIARLTTGGAQLQDLQLNLSAKQGQIRLSPLGAKLDGSTYSGDVRLDVTGAQPQLAFEMQVDELDLDRYLQTDDQAAASDTETNPEASAGGDDSLDLPVDDLRQLRLDGRIKAGKLKFSNARLSDADVNIRARDGIIRLNPLTANLYGGSYSGDMQLDVTGKQPNFSVNEKLTSVQLGTLLGDVSKIKNIDGITDARVTASATGNSINELLGNLAGDAALEMQKGVFRGMDLWYEIRKARALLKREAPPPAPAEPFTDISKLGGTAKFANGEIVNKDFAAQASYLGIDGKGTVNLLESTLDYRLEARVVGTPTFDDGKTLGDMSGTVLPITVKGKLASPSVKVDLGAVALNAGKQKLIERLEKKLGIQQPAAPADSSDSTGATPAEQPTEQQQAEPQPEDPKEQLKKSLFKMLGN